jgi:hypothetical protein
MTKKKPKPCKLSRTAERLLSRQPPWPDFDRDEAVFKDRSLEPVIVPMSKADLTELLGQYPKSRRFLIICIPDHLLRK